MIGRSYQRIGWVLLGCVPLFVLCLTLGPVGLDRVSWFRLIVFGGPAAGLLGLVAVRRLASATTRPGGGLLLAGLLLALAARLLAMQATPMLSDDAARYHWDGKVLSHGINPFHYAPDDPALDQLRHDDLDSRINHPWVHTVYPPLAQLLFAIGYRLTPGSLRGLQWLFLLAETLTLGLLWRRLDQERTSRFVLLLYAWSPLVILEGYLPGHVDLLGLPLMLLFLLSVERVKPVQAGLFLGLSLLIKPFVIVLLPAVWKHLGRRRTAILAGVATAVLIAGYLPFLAAGRKLFTSMWLMATDWSFQGSIARLLEAVLPMKIAHLVAATGLVAVVFTTLRHRTDLWGRALLAMVAWVLFTPAVFPWYLVWVMPILVLRPDYGLLAFLSVSLLFEQVQLTFELQGVWEPAGWAALVVYGVLAIGLIGAARKHVGVFSKGREVVNPPL